MKRNIIIIFTIGLFLALGCEKIPLGNAFLNKAPGVDVTQDTIFSSLEYAQRYLWAGYRTLPFGINTNANATVNGNSSAKAAKMSNDLLEDLTDLSNTYLTWGGAYTLYYNGSYTAANEDGSGGPTKYHLTHEDSFKGIRIAYNFIQNIGKVPGVDPLLAKQLKAEALMIAAIHYADMYRHYGGMPWVNKAYLVTDNMTSFTRLTAQATCDSIVALCDRAVVDLPWAITNLVEWDGRFTKVAAMGLKARILLFNASPLFNSATPYLDGVAAQQKLVWHGSYDANLWVKARDAAKALITQVEAGSDYKIYHKVGNSYRQDFQDAYYTRGTGETLISIRDMFRTPSPSWNYTFYWSAYGWGACNPTDDYVKMFPMANGKAITDITSGYDATRPFFNAAGAAVRDPRLYETVTVNGDAFKGRDAQLWIGGLERPGAGGTQAVSGYIIHKFMLDLTTSTSVNAITHWPYLRLPEIYLSYAEAQNEINNGPDAECYRCVNLIRTRVGLANLPAGLTKDQFREAVLLERALEFGWEEVRFFDLIRYKREADFRKPLHGMNITRSASAPYTYTYTQTLLPVRSWQNNWSPKWYLSAFPLGEVNKGYGLVQNPGWE